MLTAYIFCLAVGGGFLVLSLFGDADTEVDFDADFGASSVEALDAPPPPLSGLSGDGRTSDDASDDIDEERLQAEAAAAVDAGGPLPGPRSCRPSLSGRRPPRRSRCC